MMTNPDNFKNSITSDFPVTADVIIIGGGPAGTAALWALRRAAPTIRAVLVEQSDHLGAGSSLASLECYRSAWPMTCNAAQMRRSMEVFHHANEYLGEGAGQAIALHEQGYLFCAFTAQQANALRRDVEHLHSIGLTHIQYLEAEEVRYRHAWLGERVIAAKFDPMAGWLDSNALIHHFASSATSATILLGVKETRIMVANGRVLGIATAQGEISAPRVLIAAGAGSIAVAQTAGINLPVIARPRQSFTTAGRHAAYPDDSPMVIGAAPFPHTRPEARSGAIFGWEYHWNAKYAEDGAPLNGRDYLPDVRWPAEKFKDPRFPSIALYLLARQFGHADGEGFADALYLRGIRHNAGYYISRDATTAYTIDANGVQQPYESERAIIDAWPEIDGLFLSVAHVGHGIMTSPAVGEISAAQILGQPLPDPSYADFGLNVYHVAHDEVVI